MATRRAALTFALLLCMAVWARPGMGEETAADEPSILILRVPLFYQADRLKEILETHDAGPKAEPKEVDEKARLHQRKIVQKYIGAKEVARYSDMLSVRVITAAQQAALESRFKTEWVEEQSREVPDAANTNTKSKTANDENVGDDSKKSKKKEPDESLLSTGYAELIGPRENLVHVLELIDGLDRPDPILDVDVLIFRISGNEERVAEEYRKLLLQVDQAQRIGESLNIVPTIPGFAASVLPSLTSFIDSRSSTPITRDPSGEYRARQWSELTTGDDFRRRLELRSLLIGLCHASATRDGQAKGQIIRRVLMQKPFRPSDVVTTLCLTPAGHATTPYISRPGPRWMQDALPVRYAANGRLLPREEQLTAWVQYGSMDDHHIAEALGLEVRYGAPFADLTERLDDRGRKVRQAYEDRAEELRDQLEKRREELRGAADARHMPYQALAYHLWEQVPYEPSDGVEATGEDETVLNALVQQLAYEAAKSAEERDAALLEDLIQRLREKLEMREDDMGESLSQELLDWLNGALEETFGDYPGDDLLDDLEVIRLEDELARIEFYARWNIRDQYVVTITSPEEIDEILQFTQLQPRHYEEAGKTSKGRSLLFDESTMRLSSELTVQLRSGYPQTFDAGSVSSELHRFGTEDMQKLNEALAKRVSADVTLDAAARARTIDGIADLLRAAKRVMVTETLRVELTATAADFTSAHYYSSKEQTEPTFKQSAFGSIELDVGSTIQFSYAMKDTATTTGPVSASPPIEALFYHTVLDSTSYRPNLVLAANFHRELTSRPGVLPYLLTAAGAWGLAGGADASRWVGGVLAAIGLQSLKGQKTQTTQAIALVVTPRPRTPLPAEEMLDVALTLISAAKRVTANLQAEVRSARKGYRKQYGEYPRTLERLVDEGLIEDIPPDPFTGMPDWRYHVESGNVTSGAPWAQYWDDTAGGE